ncbi:MAG: amino-acid N-acetyltransferase [Porticoccaceae bacterium]|nr:amino-acid N-acetyltransferase [Porticoccaceae bacterium]
MNTNSYVDFFRQTSPYIHTHRGKTFVIALDGDTVAHGNFHRIIHDIALLQSLGIRILLVHGGRPQIDQRIAQSNIESTFHNQLRITDAAAMHCVKEALGSTRWQIESELSMGLPNSPMHGAQIRVIGGNFITAKPLGVRDGVDYQHTGKVRRVDAAAIQQQLQTGGLVLMSPIGFSPTGEAFNLSYQDVATETAIALNAEKLILVTEASGIVENGDLLRSLSVPDVDRLRNQCADAPQKMLLNTAYQACSQGVTRVHMVSCAVDGALLSELFTREGSGTLVMQDHSEVIRAAAIDDVGGILDLISPLEQQQILVKRSRELLETEISRFTLVVHPEGFLLGCAALYPMADKTEGEIACVATHPEFLGRGIASRLLEHIEAEAVQMGITKLFVLTTQTAHWFLEKGFVETAVKDLPKQKQSLYNYQRNSRIFSKHL